MASSAAVSVASAAGSDERAIAALRQALAEALLRAGFTRVAHDDDDETENDGETDASTTDSMDAKDRADADARTAAKRSKGVEAESGHSAFDPKAPVKTETVAASSAAAAAGRRGNGSIGTANTVRDGEGEGEGEDGVSGSAVTLGPSPLALLARAAEGLMMHLCIEAKRLCESANRTAANELDVACAYARMGYNVRDLVDYATCYREAYAAALAEAKGQASDLIVCTNPTEVEDYKLPVPQTVPCLLNDSSLRVTRPAHLPTHLPDYPDPHTFVRTPVYEPIEARYIEWRRERARLNAFAKASMARVAFGLTKGDQLRFAVTGTSSLQTEPVYCKANPKRGRFQHLLVATNCVLEDDEGAMETIDRSNIHFENDTEAQAAHSARIFTRVQLREPT